MSLFLSYSREDRSKIAAVISDLEQFGERVWVDEKLSGGQEWWNHILGQIRNCEAFILALSQTSVSSEACELETTYARDLEKKIVPLRLDNVALTAAPSSLAETLGKIQWIEYQAADKGGTIALLRALTDLAPRPLPDPLPADPPVPGSYLTDLLSQIDSPEDLNKQRQLELLFELRKRAADRKHQSDIERLLRRFRQRDDLLAKIAEQADELIDKLQGTADVERTATEISSTKSLDEIHSDTDHAPPPASWTAELVSRAHDRVVLSVRLTHYHHHLEWFQELFTNVVKLDGKVVSKGSGFSTERHRFSFADGPDIHEAELFIGGIFRPSTVVLTVAGRSVYTG